MQSPTKNNVASYKFRFCDTKTLLAYGKWASKRFSMCISGLFIAWRGCVFLPSAQILPLTTQLKKWRSSVHFIYSQHFQKVSCSEIYTIRLSTSRARPLSKYLSFYPRLFPLLRPSVFTHERQPVLPSFTTLSTIITMQQDWDPGMYFILMLQILRKFGFPQHTPSPCPFRTGLWRCCTVVDNFTNLNTHTR